MMMMMKFSGTFSEVLALKAELAEVRRENRLLETRLAQAQATIDALMQPPHHQKGQALDTHG